MAVTVVVVVVVGDVAIVGASRHLALRDAHLRLMMMMMMTRKSEVSLGETFSLAAY